MLIAAALAVSLVFGGAFVTVGRLHSTPSDVLEHPGNPLDDDQSKTQVIEPARQIAALTQLRTSAAGYALMSCKSQHDPPYQGAIYLTFSLPAATPAGAFFSAAAATLVDHGWIEGSPPNNHPLARILSKDGIAVILYRHDDDPALGVLRVYGQCRDTADHRADGTTWTDITERFTGTG